MGLNNCTIQGNLFSCVSMYKVTVTHGQEEPVHHSREHLEQASTIFVNQVKEAAAYVATVSINPVPPVIVQLFSPAGKILKQVNIAAIKNNNN